MERPDHEGHGAKISFLVFVLRALGNHSLRLQCGKQFGRFKVTLGGQVRGGNWSC